MTKVTPDRIALLRGIQYFRALPPVDLSRLADCAVVRDVRRGARVFEEGAPAEGLFVVMQGRVRLVRRSRGGREQVLHVEGPGATLGGGATPRRRRICRDGGSGGAEPPSLPPRDIILDTCRRHPDVALGIIRVLARRMRTFAGLVEELSLKNLTTRLAGFLLAESASANASMFTLAVTRDDIATRLGTVRELVSRSLGRLRAAGVIEIAGRRVTIRDVRRLSAIAEGQTLVARVARR